RVVFTDRGRAMLAAGDRIKAELESGIVARIGAARFADLRAVLKALAE
ncbi:MAG: MarR family transcriptional regulator, partial [Rhodobacteraceae bacterium]|nr:MarR family transcriptional regulator [Paracoccaceae bacterium]